MPDLLLDAATLAGFALIVFGVAMVSLPAATIVAGLVMATAGLLLARRR